MKKIMLVPALVATLVAGLPQHAAADVVTPPVPGNLAVPAGNAAYLAAHARGTQNYICLAGQGGFAWTFFGPQATLVDDGFTQVATHFLSPNPVENGTPRATWQDSGDTSAVWAGAIASSTDPTYVAQGAIPWLLLHVVGAQYGPTWGARLTATTFIQRVNTVGGVAPTAGCKNAEDVGRKALVPYAADYVFYRAQ